MVLFDYKPLALSVLQEYDLIVVDWPFSGYFNGLPVSKMVSMI